METSGKKILGSDWIKRLARRFTPEQFRQQYLAKPLAQHRMEEQAKRLTDEQRRKQSDGIRRWCLQHPAEVRERSRNTADP